MPNYSKSEDSLLLKLVSKYGTEKWEQIAKKFKIRTERSLRIRWAKLKSKILLNHQEWTLSDDMYLFALIINAIDKNMDTIVSKHSKCSMKDKIINRVQEFTNTILSSITEKSERCASVPASEERKQDPTELKAPFKRRRSAKAIKKENDADSYKPRSKRQDLSSKKLNTRSGQQIDGLSVGDEQNEHLLCDIPCMISNVKDINEDQTKSKSKRKYRKNETDRKTPYKKGIDLNSNKNTFAEECKSKPIKRRKKTIEESKILIVKPIEEKSVGLDELLAQNCCLQSPQPQIDFSITKIEPSCGLKLKNYVKKPTRSKSLISRRAKKSETSHPPKKPKKEIIIQPTHVEVNPMMPNVSVRKSLKNEVPS